MTYSFDVNNAAMTSAQAFYKIKVLWLSKGWTVLSSSDGTTFSSNSDLITSGNTGAGGLGNANAWFRIKMPFFNSASREFTVKRTNSTDWIVNYSYSAGFVTGGSATVTPTAIDQASLVSGAFFPADSGYRFNAAVGDASDGYGFWMGCFPVGGGVPSGGNFCMVPMLNGTYSSGDVDPFVFYIHTTATAAFLASSLTGNCKTWFRKGLSNESFLTMNGCAYFNTAGVQFVPNNANVNPHNGKDDIFSIPYGLTSGISSYPGGFKGIGNLIMWNGTTRTTGDTISTTGAGSKDRIVYRDVNLPWNGSTPTV